MKLKYKWSLAIWGLFLTTKVKYRKYSPFSGIQIQYILIYLIHIHLQFSVEDGRIQLNKKYIAGQADFKIEPVYITKLYRQFIMRLWVVSTYSQSHDSY